MRAFGLAALILVAGAQACINDRDTLAFEQRNIDALDRLGKAKDYQEKADIVAEIGLKAISGRFERFPPEYYKMRIRRLEAKPSLTSHEDDDLAVAYERIGQTDKAIQLILASKPRRKSQDDWYRFHANYGTFLVHKWVASPNRSKDKTHLKQSIAEIEKAVDINPDSHFKRERYQLMLEKHWLDPEGDEEVMSMSDGGEAVVGFAGIAMMGLGYELPDVYWLMSHEHVPGMAEESTLQTMASSRAMDLEARGIKPISSKLGVYPKPDIDPDYKRLRADGEKVHNDRQAYIKERFARDEHPDTHPNFWADWEEPAMPVIKREKRTPLRNVENSAPLVLGGIGITASVLAALAIASKRFKR